MNTYSNSLTYLLRFCSGIESKGISTPSFHSVRLNKKKSLFKPPKDLNDENLHIALPFCFPSNSVLHRWMTPPAPSPTPHRLLQCQHVSTGQSWQKMTLQCNLVKASFLALVLVGLLLWDWLLLLSIAVFHDTGGYSVLKHMSPLDTDKCSFKLSLFLTSATNFFRYFPTPTHSTIVFIFKELS